MKSYSLESPTFSIIIPTYNRPSMLKRAIQSVIKQTYNNFELIIIDDFSTISNQEIILEFDDGRIKYTRNDVNKGTAAARNIGVDIAKGTYISFLDDDDEYFPMFLANTCKVLKDTSSNIGFSWSSVEYIDYNDDNKATHNRRIREFTNNHKTKEELFAEVLSIGAGFGVTIKSDCLRKIGGFNKLLKTIEDTDLFLRLLINGFLPVVVPEIGIRLHNHHYPRLTGVEKHSARIKECKWLLEQYQIFYQKHSLLKDQLNRHILNLTNELYNSMKIEEEKQ